MSSNEDSNVFRAAKLTADNYHNWKFSIKMMLIGRDLWEIVEGSEVLPEEATNKQAQEFRKRVNKALSLICLSVSDNLQIYVRNAKTGKEAWDSLQNHFEEKTLSRKVSLHQKLYSARMGNGSMIEHVNNIRTIADQLEALDDLIEEKYLVMILLSSLPKEYNNLLTTLETLKEDNLTWDYVRDRVLTESERRTNAVDSRTPHDALLAGGGKHSGSGDGFPPGGAGGSGGNGHNKVRCHYCNETGHIQRNCEKKRAHVAAKVEKAKQEQEKATASFCSSKPDKNKFFDFCPEFALHVQAEPSHGVVDNSDDSKWMLDSACSNHMTGNKSNLVNYKDFDDDKPLLK